MMISQPALMCLEATWRRMMERGAADLELDSAPIPRQAKDRLDLTSDLAAETLATVPDAVPNLVDASLPEHPPRDDRRANLDLPLTADERRARAAALRGLALSRGRRFDAAGVAFLEAARLDPMLDLTRIPGFWKLERAAHEAAIAAYQDSGRERDAAVLRARVRSTYRPRPIRPRAGAALPS